MSGHFSSLSAAPDGVIGNVVHGALNELRLQRAFKLLTEPHGSAPRISDIALEVGFSDISHFNRLFRARLAFRRVACGAPEG